MISTWPEAWDQLLQQGNHVMFVQVHEQAAEEDQAIMAIWLE